MDTISICGPAPKTTPAQAARDRCLGPSDVARIKTDCVLAIGRISMAIADMSPDRYLRGRRDQRSAARQPARYRHDLRNAASDRDLQWEPWARRPGCATPWLM